MTDPTTSQPGPQQSTGPQHPTGPDRPIGPNRPIVTAVVASTPDGIIGADQSMPWRLSTDLRRFKKLTMGQTMVMGRRTFDSIGRVLPGRQTIVLTRQTDWRFGGVDVAHDDAQVFALNRSPHLFIVGGGQIYAHWWDRCDAIAWTRVWANLDGDTRIELPQDEFSVISRSQHVAGEKNDFPTDFFQMIRKKVFEKSSFLPG